MRSAPAAKRGEQLREESGRGHVHTNVKDRDGPYHDQHSDDVILTRRFREGEQAAYVKIGAGMTIPLARQFEMLRIDVSISLPCLPEEIEDTYVIASDWVAEKIAEEETNWLGTPQQGKAKRG